MRTTIFIIGFFTIAFCSLSIFAAEDTAAQIPIGIAVGPDQNIEVSFANMTNGQNCSYNGAFVIEPTLDKTTKNQMLALLMQAKALKLPIKVRLNGCVDRPKFFYVFLDENWF